MIYYLSYSSHPNVLKFVLSILYRQVFGGMGKDQYCESDHICYEEHGDACDCSNFLDVDWLSSSGNSCEEELLERCDHTLIDKLIPLLSCCYFLRDWPHDDD
jgi:hypothetical protein